MEFHPYNTSSLSSLKKKKIKRHFIEEHQLLIHPPKTKFKLCVAKINKLIDILHIG